MIIKRSIGSIGMTINLWPILIVALVGLFAFLFYIVGQ